MDGSLTCPRRFRCETPPPLTADLAFGVGGRCGQKGIDEKSSTGRTTRNTYTRALSYARGEGTNCLKPLGRSMSRFELHLLRSGIWGWRQRRQRSVESEGEGLLSLGSHLPPSPAWTFGSSRFTPSLLAFSRVALLVSLGSHPPRGSLPHPPPLGPVHSPHGISHGICIFLVQRVRSLGCLECYEWVPRL